MDEVANGQVGRRDHLGTVSPASTSGVASATARTSAEPRVRRFRPPAPPRTRRLPTAVPNSAPQPSARQSREPVEPGSPASQAGPDADPPGPARRLRAAGGGALLPLLDEPGLTWVVAVAAGVGAALAGCHPTGTPVVDPLYTALFAAGTTLAASRAARSPLLILGAVAVVMSRGALVLPAAAALLAAFGSVFLRRSYRVGGALVGALAVQAVVRWPAVGFHGLTALVAAAAVIPCAVSAYRHTPDRLRHWLRRAAIAVPIAAIVLSVPIAAAALLAHRDVSAGISATTGALGAVSDGTTASGTQQLRTASADFASASRRTGAWWTGGGRLVPVVAQQRQVLARATAVARDVTAAVGDEADRAKGSTLAYTGGGIDLTKVAALAQPLRVIDSRLKAAVGQLASVRSGWVVGPLQSRFAVLDGDITKAHSGAQIASQVVGAAPSLFGGEGVRHYFVDFMTPAESRGLGGFTGAYGELTVDQGHVTLTRNGDIADLNAVPDGTRQITGPADYVARYGPFQPQNFFQDLTYAPDLPTVAQVIAQMYPQSGGDQIDGVLALDPEALAALLNFTGPIDIANIGVVNASNAAEVLLKGQYATIPAPTQQAARHDYLQDALGVAFQKLTTGSLPGPQTLSATLDPAVRQGRLLFWSLHPSDQPVLRRLGLDGSFPSAQGKDLLALTTQNAANNKLDAYLQRSIDDHVTYDPGNGQVGATVKITLHNEAPSTGLAPDVLGSYPGSGLAPGTNRTWLSLYTPLTLTAANLDGGPLPLPITSTPELGVNAYSVYVNIPAGATVTLLVGLRGQIHAGSSYQLTLHQQPLVLPDKVSVHVTGPNPTGSDSWSPGPAADQARLFKFAT